MLQHATAAVGFAQLRRAACTACSMDVLEEEEEDDQPSPPPLAERPERFVHCDNEVCIAPPVPNGAIRYHRSVDAVCALRRASPAVNPLLDEGHAALFVEVV
ncbi:unnamed protein product [Lampetra fluviatilis]